MSSIGRIIISDPETARPVMVSDMLHEVMNIALAPGNAFYPYSERRETPPDHYRFTSIVVPPDLFYRNSMEAYYPGFYGWENIDFLHIYTGELILNLSDGRTVLLNAGDMFVLNGSLQSCRNPGTIPVNAIAVTIYPE